MAISVALALVLAAPAGAAIFRGSTSQGEQATLRTDGEGVPTRFWLKKYKAGCRGRAFYRDRGAGAVRPFDVATARRLYDKGPRYVIRDGSLRLSILTAVRARRVSDQRWTGSFKSRVTVRQRGDIVNKCKADFEFGARLVRGAPFDRRRGVR